jgi:hypothetical protein
MNSLDDFTLNRKRLRCVIKSMALTAHFVGFADRKFDQKERDEAAKMGSLFQKWDTLFYTLWAEEVDEEEIRGKLAKEIAKLDDSSPEKPEILAEFTEQYQAARMLFKYTVELLDSMGISELILTSRIEGLSIDMDQFEDTGTGLKELRAEIYGKLPESFEHRVLALLVQYGTLIANVSGFSLGRYKISRKELTSVYEINRCWGGTDEKAMEIIDQTKDAISVMKTANRFLGNDQIAIPIPRLENDSEDDENSNDDKIIEKDESDKKNEEKN